MTGLIRFSVSLDEPLYNRFMDLVNSERYGNRSEFVRDMIRDQLVQGEWAKDSEVVGTITLVYNHHTKNIVDKLIDIQHHCPGILASTHVHLDHHVCAEMIMVKTEAKKLRKIASLLKQQKGVLHCALSMTSTGKDLP